MYTIYNMTDKGINTKDAINFYYKAWGNGKNFNYFNDAITHSINTPFGLPQFYALVKKETIIGCCGLITSEDISRGDLTPWLAGLYIEEKERGNQAGQQLLQNAENETRKLNYEALHLVTHLDGFYEKYGWKRIDDGYEMSGAKIRIYKKKL